MVELERAQKKTLANHARNADLRNAIYPKQGELIPRCARIVTVCNGENMYIHEEIQRAVLPLLEKYDLELIDLIGELNHAAWELSVLNKNGIKKLTEELNGQG